MLQALCLTNNVDIVRCTSEGISQRPLYKTPWPGHANIRGHFKYVGEGARGTASKHRATVHRYRIYFSNTQDCRDEDQNGDHCAIRHGKGINTSFRPQPDRSKG